MHIAQFYGSAILNCWSTTLKTQHFPERSGTIAELSFYLTEQRHILLEEGNVEEHCKVVEEGELKEERKEMSKEGWTQGTYMKDCGINKIVIHSLSGLFTDL